MTNPVILLGTQSNGETLPVQVDATGRLVAEGLQGQPGAEGPPGPPGVGQLPPDPYEGALLGWLNGGLAWVGTPPVPVPEGVFGPITAWSAQDGLLEVEGEIPSSVGNGVYIYQCNQDGTYYTKDWNTSEIWSDGVISSISSTKPITNAFDGNPATYAEATTNRLEIISPAFSNGNYLVEVKSSGGSSSITCDGWPLTFTGSNNLWKGTVANPFPLVITHTGPDLYYVKVDGVTLVDTDQSLSMRVNTVYGNALIGSQIGTQDFTVGKYLFVPPQRIAPWVLYGNDPSQLLDHLKRRGD